MDRCSRKFDQDTVKLIGNRVITASTNVSEITFRYFLKLQLINEIIYISIIIIITFVSHYNAEKPYVANTSATSYTIYGKYFIS